jgi:uncharacterized paraquat-inducible protein A
MAFEVKKGESFIDALKREVRNGCLWKYAVCKECGHNKRISRGDVCARCQEKLVRKRRRQ